MEKKTKFQDLVVFDSETWGRVMLLDGVIQITDRDEMSYQEMLAQVPMHCHKKPERVLIVGGGDGGMLREVCRHESVKYVKMVDIDGDVIEACKQYFPKVAVSFSDPRADVEVGDGVGFVKNFPIDTEEGFDVIIVDSSDPVGPAEGLFSAEFYKNIQRILKPDGVIGAQGECLWVNQDMILDMLATHSQPFALAQYASIQVPTYPCGQIGIFLARNHGKLGNRTMAEPQNTAAKLEDLRYWSVDMHRAAFALPKSLADKVDQLAKIQKAVRTESLFINAAQQEEEQERILRKASKPANNTGVVKMKRSRSNSDDEHPEQALESAPITETTEIPKGLDENGEVVNPAKRSRRGATVE